jgi:Replication-relaxation
MPPALRLQPRDLRLLTELGETGLLDTATLRARHFPADRTGEACLRRLRLYAAHGLTEAIAPAVSVGLPRGGRLPAIHRLTPRGAAVLQQVTGEAPRRTLKSGPRPETLLHRLGCAKLQLLVSDACARAAFPAPQWIAEYDAVPGVGPSVPLSERFVLCQRYRMADGTTHTCWPDAACLLAIPGHAIGATPETHALIVLWKFDRSTETLTQVARKLPGYREFLARGDWRRPFPSALHPTVRVFVVTLSAERLEHIAAALRGQPGSESVRLAVVGDLTPERFFTAPLFRTVAGDARPILRPSSSAA